MMDQRIFASGPMGLHDQLLRIPIERPITYHPVKTGSSSISKAMVFTATKTWKRFSGSSKTGWPRLGRKVYAVVNYDNFEIFPDVIDEYLTMVRDQVDRFYSGVTRYMTSSFLRAKLGDALKQRAVAPHMYESAEEAAAHLRDLKD
jgi:propionate CoA-transferase